MIDKVTQESLRAQFNPDDSELRSIQLRLLNILLEIDRICKANDITYWLSGGTMLGAIRHNGFIPWDDDIDIEMYYEDFKKFENYVITNGFSNVNYVLQNNTTDENYLGIISKVVDTSIQVSDIYNQNKFLKYKGLFVDIFPVRKSNKIIYNIFRPYERILGRFQIHAKTKVKYCFLKIFRYITYTCFISFISWLISKVGNDYFLLLGSRWKSTPRSKNIILPVKDYLFENHYFPGPNDADTYLTLAYGDYSKIPQISDIKRHLMIK